MATQKKATASVKKTETPTATEKKTENLEEVEKAPEKVEKTKSEVYGEAKDAFLTAKEKVQAWYDATGEAGARRILNALLSAEKSL